MTRKGWFPVQEVYRGERQSGEEIIELDGGAFLMPSFTDPKKVYKVHPDSGYCRCPRAENAPDGFRCKHVVLAEAIENARSLRFGSESAERSVIELCKRIFAPIKRNADYADSHDLLLDAAFYRYSTPAMHRAAKRRHMRILAMYGVSHEG
jgi:hypothetical protein